MKVWKLLGWIIIGVWLNAGIALEYILAIRFHLDPPALMLGFMIGLFFPLEMIVISKPSQKVLNFIFGPLLRAIYNLLEKEI
jgi:hypothetical protein